MIPTPHIEVTDQSKIAKTVLMPGDPLRAQYIANRFLENVEQFNGVRGMLGFTGTYKGVKVSVMGSGMGMPSIGIYSYELYKFYGVENIIRVGSCGSYSPKLNVFDVVLANAAYSESSFALTQNGDPNQIQEASEQLNQIILNQAKQLGIDVTVSLIHSSDVFYREETSTELPTYQRLYQELNCDVVEMESFALFHNAKVLNTSAACLLTVSDSFITHEVTTSAQRQTAFEQMMLVALEAAIKI